MHRLQERGALAPLSGSAVRASRRRLLASAGLALFVVVADQVTKALAVSRLSDDRSIHLIGPFSLMLAYNRGVAFSLGATVGAPLVVLAVLIVGAVVMLGRRLPGRAASVAVALIAGGALGNLADRLFRPQGVVDFLHSTFWPTFNVADSAITIGCVVLAVSVIWAHEPAAEPLAGEGS